MKIVVTGGNGFIGSWVVKKLSSMGHDVTCLVRVGSDISKISWGNSGVISV